MDGSPAPTSRQRPQQQNGNLADSPGELGQQERQMLEAGKAEHRQTTDTAKRALQVAEKTRDVARSTLVEMHRQGQQLERAELGLDRVGREVKEASAILRFMRRWCCFQCCDCCDPTLDQDLSRKKRVAMQAQGMQYEQQNIGMKYAAKQQAVGRLCRQHDPAYGGSDEGAVRRELMAQADSIRAARRGTRSTDLGAGLPEGDRGEIQRETDTQDELLDRIGDAVTSLHSMSKEMFEELGEQAPRIDRLQDHATRTHDQLGSLARDARRV